MEQVFDRQTFTGDTIVIDDCRFIKCVFISCTLRYCGGDWSLDDCRISEDCTWSFGGPAYKTAALLKTFGMIKAATILETRTDEIN